MATESTAITYTTAIAFNSETITFQDTSPTYGSGDLSWAEASNAILVKITDPTGTVSYNNTNGSSPDATGVDASFTTSLPQDADGNVLQGQYIIRITYFDVSDTGLSNAYYRDYVYTLTYSRPVHDIDVSHSIFNPKFFLAVDETDYDVNSITPTTTRDFRRYNPTTIGGYIQSTTSTINTNSFYTGTNTIYLKSTLSYTFTDGYWSDASGTAVNYTLTDIITTAALDYVVSDTTSICDFYCPLKEVYNGYYNNKTTNVGKANSYLAKYEEGLHALTMLQLSIDCGKSTDIQTYVNRLTEILGDGCECSSTNTPTLVTGVGVINNLERVYSKTTSSNTTAYTFLESDAATGSSTSSNAALIGLTYNKDFIVTVDGISDTGGTFDVSTGEYTFSFTVTSGAVIQAIIIRP